MSFEDVNYVGDRIIKVTSVDVEGVIVLIATPVKLLEALD